MIRFLERQELLEIFAKNGDATALRLAAQLENSTSTELITAEPVTTSTLLPTYETRLAVAERGMGPRTEGLGNFVSALRGESSVEIFSVALASGTAVGLLTTDGNLLAITLVAPE